MGKQVKPVIEKDYTMLVRGEGIYLYDDKGNRYIDGSSGVGVTSLGYGIEEIVETIKTQAQVLPFSHGLRFNNEAMERLSNLIGEFTTDNLKWSYFTCGGSEAVESVIKLCRQYYLEKDKPMKH